MKHIKVLLPILLFFSSCVNLRWSPGNENVTIKQGYFDYSPPSSPNYNDTNKITLLLINPRLNPTNTKPMFLEDPVKTFVKNMGSDYLEMLIAKGLPFKGPFNSYDEVVFSDKEQADLCFEPELELDFTGNPLKHKNAVYSGDGSIKYADACYWLDGTVALTGKMNLFLYEPFTHVKLWIKSIPIQSEEFILKSSYKYRTENIPLSDPGVNEIVQNQLNAIYKKVFEASWNQLNYSELKMRNEEAKRIRTKAGFKNKE
jgi:hypothetical protein